MPTDARVSASRRRALTLLLTAPMPPAFPAERPAPTTLRLARVFGDHMVLQRGRPIRLWGWGRAGAEVRGTLEGPGGTASARGPVDAQGRWRLELPARPAGGPLELRVEQGGEALRLRDVLIGDVWLLGGQSNMAWPLKDARGGDADIAAVDAPRIRHLRVPLQARARPQDDIPAAPWVAARAGGDTAEFSAVGWSFARRLQAELDVPVGLVNVAWNGSNLETWVRRDAARADPELAAAAEETPADDAALAAKLGRDVIARVEAFQGPAALATDHSNGADPSLDHGDWPTLQAPQWWESQGLAGLDGVVWYRRSVVLTPAQAAGVAVLHLAKVDDHDDTYVNGVHVGSTRHHDTPRRYPLPAGLLRAGANTIAVRVTDLGGYGGLHGDPAMLRLDTAAGPVPLAGRWHARVAEVRSAAEATANDAPSLAHNGMVAPLRGLPLRGVLWYQGESNVGRAAAYADAFRRLIVDWRRHFDDPRLPFVYAQLAPFGAVAANDLDRSGWADLRDAQRHALTLPGTAMAVLTDAGDDGDLHPRDKRTVGERFAVLARRLLEDGRAGPAGPVMQQVQREGPSLVATFDDHGLGLVTRPTGSAPQGFAVAGPDGRFRAAQARLEGRRVVAWHPDIAEPVALRFGWVDNPQQNNLHDAQGWPAWPFSHPTGGSGVLPHAGARGVVRVRRFRYRGLDAEPAVPVGHYRNPILPGCHPDPTLCRVGDDHYLVTSSFAWYPGLPIHHSRDLVRWRLVGHAIDRPRMLRYAGLGVSRGLFAPALSFHRGTFHLVCTMVDGGGNFLVTATDPAGPWSDPQWLPFDGIDPSLFFDDDGSAWMLNNGPPDGTPRYDGHRAIWIQRFDADARQLVGPRRVLVDGGADPATNPVWIEGPHLLRRGGWYLLTAAEGGTSVQHSQVVFRSRHVLGPYEPWRAGNPILTQRDLDPSVPGSVTCAGHAQLVEARDGRWWASFLGCRPLPGGHWLNGRETFLLPVRWTDDGWPVILPRGERVPQVLPSPQGTSLQAEAGEVVDDYTGVELDPSWVRLRAPEQRWWRCGDGGLEISPRPDRLAGSGTPSFVARRVAHGRFDAELVVEPPDRAGAAVGLALFQSERQHLTLTLQLADAGVVARLEAHRDGRHEVLARAPVDAAATVELRLSSDGDEIRAEVAARPLGAGVPTRDLSVQTAGGGRHFTGLMVGPVAWREVA
ncbi:MAG: family 43 glycosylhydrolase [Rubrivivax sp.]|nr:family 43 glycosylhydrolase [Rubrivivax sp.]